METKQNYQKILEQTISEIEGLKEPPTLMLHSCCAPCSSYVLEYLSRYFAITVFYYNPNIYPPEEFYKRREEQEKFIGKFPARIPIKFMGTEYGSEKFYEAVKGLEHIPEGGERCFACFRLRLWETALAAKAAGSDYFTTTLSISPLKNAAALNRIGGEIAEEVGVKYLYSDFKKKNGYKRSTELSKEYGIYRQDYCGCVYSMQEARSRRQEKSGGIDGQP
ncbi:MAG: epoxyqueuosine reductase QueH [Oscillospiraceae bacterium]|nr:epoxyqueuosine reductase QueH [Oscillospiraceae bacterium]